MKKSSFKTDYVLEMNKYLEFQEAYNITNKNYVSVLIYALIVDVCSLLILSYKVSIIISMFILAFLMLFTFLNKSKINYNRIMSLSGGKKVNNIITFNDKDIVGKEKNKKDSTKYLYSDICDIIESENLIILRLKCNMGIVVDKNNLSGGTIEEFKNFVLAKIKKKKIKSIKYIQLIRFITIIYVIIIFIILILSILGIKY